jgi:copper chaperone
MMDRRFALLGIATAALLLGAAIVHAADPAPITISIQGMHCPACAANVSGKLQSVTGVEKAQADAEKAVAVVTAKSDVVPSPRALWEAVEKAGYKPTKLVGPAGTFTSKPKS